MSTFSRTATLFSTVALGSMLTASTVSSVDTVIHAAETTQTAAQKQSYKLQILQGDKDAPSTASQFYLDTISLEKLANGNYYAYLTSNTPTNLGDEPIASTDTQHQVVNMGTTQKNGYNQTVYRMTLSASELASGQPIKTNIHVNIPMMNYDHNYTIRLGIQGFKPETTTSSQSTSSVSSASTTNNSSVTPRSNVVPSSKTESSVANSAPQSTENNTVSSTDTSKSTVAKTEPAQNDSQQVTSDTTASTVDDSKTTESTVETPAGTEVKMSADQGMDRFLKPSAYINIKGDTTDVTLSFNSTDVISMIPYMIFDGQKKEVTNQNITFTIPTKDLTADKDGNVAIASTTHVDAPGHVMDYPSNLTFNISQLLPAQKTFKTGDYQIAVSPDSNMDRFFAPKFNVKVGDVTSVVTVTYQDTNMVAMIPNVTFDGQTKDLKGKTTVDFTIPTKDLMPDKDGKATIASFTSVPMSPHKGYASNITFNMNPALVNPVNDKPDQSSSSSSETSTKPDKDILQDGTYSINYNVYKSGTTDASTMANYMTQSANITVKKGEATIDFATKNDAMSMMKEFSINGAKAQAKGDSWIVKLPVKDLVKTATAQMTIEVPQINFTEKPSADIVFDMDSIKNLDNTGSSSSSSSAVSSSKPTTPAKPTIENDGKYTIDYKVYKSGTTDTSTMATYMTEAAKVTVKNGQATIDFATKNAAMSMMQKFSVNGVKAEAKGDSWLVTLPAKDLNKTLTAQMTIFVAAINFTETPSADISFDMKSLKVLDDGGSSSSSSASSSSKPSSSSSSAASSSKPSQSSSSAASSSKPSQNSSSAASSSKPSSSSSSAASSSKPSQSSSSAASSSKPSQSSSSAASSSKPSSSSSSASSSSKPNQSSSSTSSSSKPSQSSSSAASSSKPSQSSSSAASSSKPTTPAKSTIENDGKYAIDYKVYKSGTTDASTMATYMTESAKVTVKDGQATIDFATKNAAMSMMQEFSVNGAKATAKGDSWLVTLPAKDLNKTLTAQMTIFVAAINFTETPSADISFDMKSLKVLDNASGSSSSSSSSSSSASSSSKPSQSSSSAASSSKPSSSSSSASSSSKPSSSSAASSSKPEKKLTTDFNDGTYNNVNYHIYKSGTTKNSTMSQYMTTSAKVVIKDGKATISFATKNNAMSMMKTFSVNGVNAKKDGNNWTVTVPAKNLAKTLTSHMHIEVPQIGLTEDPDADIAFDLNSLKKSGSKDYDFTKTKTDKNTATGANGAVSLPTGHQNAIRNAVLHQLTILHGNNNSTSVAAQYFLPTVQLVHNANGSYTGYITTHTPVMMGRNPISFMDGKHQVKLVNTIKTGNYYQSTYQLSLSENEIKAPIATSIHVKFTAPLNYDHIYTIRLVIGRVLNNAGEATQPTTGLPDASGLTTSPLDSDVSHGTFATDFNDDTITGSSFTALNNTNTDSQNNDGKNDTTKPQTKKNSNATQVTKDDQSDSKSNNTTQRNVLIVAGGILAAALGYVGVALLTNFFKMR
ncbi:NEAT domain-containing protein [Weissella hellenica]|uniref:NEAT domain-containing protein n=1 Tax=Weissella hellenica TaxID=46256 RepID=UPI00388B7EA6